MGDRVASPSGPRYLTIGDVAIALGMREWQVDRLVKRGLVPQPRRAGSRRFWEESDLEGIKEAGLRAGYLKPTTPA